MYTAGAVYFDDPQKDFEIITSPYVAGGKAIQMTCRYLKQHKNMERLEYMIHRAREFSNDTLDTQLDYLFAEFKAWCFDYEENAVAVHYENIAESISHHFQQPFRGPSIDHGFKMLGSTIKVVMLMGENHGYALKDADFKYIF